DRRSNFPLDRRASGDRHCPKAGTGRAIRDPNTHSLTVGMPHGRTGLQLVLSEEFGQDLAWWAAIGLHHIEFVVRIRERSELRPEQDLGTIGRPARVIAKSGDLSFQAGPTQCGDNEHTARPIFGTISNVLAIGRAVRWPLATC